MKKINNIKPDVRTLEQMKNVLYDQNWAQKADNDLELYYMYRKKKKKGHLHTISNARQRIC